MCGIINVCHAGQNTGIVHHVEKKGEIIKQGPQNKREMIFIKNFFKKKLIPLNAQTASA